MKCTHGAWIPGENTFDYFVDTLEWVSDLEDQKKVREQFIISIGIMFQTCFLKQHQANATSCLPYET